MEVVVVVVVAAAAAAAEVAAIAVVTRSSCSHSRVSILCECVNLASEDGDG